MKFILSKVHYNNKITFLPASQIVEHIWCDVCDNRNKSKLSIGLTLRGLQVWCDNCEKNILHIDLHGELKADPLPQGRFNERAKHNCEEIMNKYSISSKDLKIRKEEELTNSDIDPDNLTRRDHIKF